MLTEEVVAKPKEKKEVLKGLKRLRAGSTGGGGGKPDFYCENCKCHRFSTCGCMKKVA
jgi:hypothetical protein